MDPTCERSASSLTGSLLQSEEFREFLVDAMSYVALGTVADVVRLDQTNRVFVEQGLARRFLAGLHLAGQVLRAGLQAEQGGAVALELRPVAVRHPQQLADRQRRHRQREQLHYRLLNSRY